jgi:hypothetical protein
VGSRRAVGREFDVTDDELAVVEGFLVQFAAPEQAELRGDAYAAPVPWSDGSRLDRVIALSGRDPAWPTT